MGRLYHLVVEARQIDVFPRRFVLRTPARDNHYRIGRLDKDAIFDFVHKEQAARNNRCAGTRIAGIRRCALARCVDYANPFTPHIVRPRCAQPAFHATGERSSRFGSALALSEYHRRRNRKECVGLQFLQVPRRFDAKVHSQRPSVDGGVPAPRSPLGVLPRLQRAVRHHHSDFAALAQV